MDSCSNGTLSKNFYLPPWSFSLPLQCFVSIMVLLTYISLFPILVCKLHEGKELGHSVHCYSHSVEQILIEQTDIKT